jgi:PAS domain S-box-containing protein
VRDAEVHQTEIARNIARELDIDLIRLADSLNSIAEHASLRNMDIDNQTETLFQYVNLLSDISNLFVMNKTGWFVSGTSENMSNYYTMSYDFAPFFIASFELGEIYFAPPTSYFNNTLVATFVGVPIESDTGERVGVLLGTMRLNNLIQRISDYPLNEDQVLYMVDKEGRVVAHSEIDLFTLEEGPLSLNYSSLLLVQEITSGGITGTHEYMINSTNYTGVNVVIESSGWGVIVETPRDKIRFESNILVQNLWLFNIAIFSIALVVTLVFTQQIMSMHERSEEAIRESEERLRTFIYSATDAIDLWNSDLKLIDCNQAVIDNFPAGTRKENLIGKNITELIPDLKETGRYDQYIEVLKTGKPYHSESFASHSKFGKKFFSVQAFQVGEGLGMITRDITDQKQAQKMQKELEQHRENFIWMASHELRTPLTVITGYIDFLTDKIDNIDHIRREKIFKIIRNSLGRLERLTNEVSLLAQLERGIFKIKKYKFNFCTLFEDVAKSFENLLGEQLEYCGCQTDAPVLIEGDEDRLQQVLDNLIRNAINHTHPEHRKIKLNLNILPNSLLVTIVDDGAGLVPEILERIFDQFISIETEYATPGTGIGLYLSRKIMEAHEGTITAQSKGLGHGATFIVELPR